MITRSKELKLDPEIIRKSCSAKVVRKKGIWIIEYNLVRTIPDLLN